MADKVNHRSSKPDMLAYAEEELGVKLDENLDRSEIWAKLKEIDKTLSGQDSAAPAGDSNQNPDTEKESGKRPARVVILIHQLPTNEEADEDPQTHITVCANGRNYQIQIGVEVPVPYVVYDVLKNAKQRKPQRKKDPATGKVSMTMVEKLRYPFTFVRNVE